MPGSQSRKLTADLISWFRSINRKSIPRLVATPANEVPPSAIDMPYSVAHAIPEASVFAKGYLGYSRLVGLASPPSLARCYQRCGPLPFLSAILLRVCFPRRSEICVIALPAPPNQDSGPVQKYGRDTPLLAILVSIGGAGKTIIFCAPRNPMLLGAFPTKLCATAMGAETHAWMLNNSTCRSQIHVYSFSQKMSRT